MSNTLSIITDTHVGCRSSSSIFREYFRWWYSTQFFPELDKRGVTEILHLGDFFDNRNSISLQDIDFVVNYFAGELKERDIQFTITLGNHDVAYKNTNKIHSLSMLKSSAPDHVTVIEEAQEMAIAGHNFVLVPWINTSNYDETFELINSVKDKADKIIAGHFELAGFPMYKGGKVSGYNYSDINKRINKFVDVRVESQSDLSNLVRALEDRIALLDTSP